MHNMSIQENQMQFKFGRELNNNEKRDLQNHHRLRKPALTGHIFKELFRSQATKAKTSDHLLGRMDKLFQGDGHVLKANNSSKGGQIIAEEPNSSCEGQSPCRMVCKQKLQSCSNDETQSFHDRKKETPDVFNLNTSAQYHHEPSAGSLHGIPIEGEQQSCVTCGHGGQLLCCAGQGCCRSFHLACIRPTFTYVPPGVWHCIWCITRKIDIDVYAVSKGIESILDVMVEVSENGGKQKEKKYLVKYKGLAHIHNRWVSGETLLLECPALFSRYKQKNKKVSWKKEWTVPQRLLAKRFLVFPEQPNSLSHENNDCCYEWLVKWKGLGYENATWELENASFLRTPGALQLKNDFEILHMKEDHFEKDKRRKKAFSELPELPFGCQKHLIHVNKLRGYWQRDQNALVIDDQERVVRVVLFVLSLLKETKGPFLIVTTSTALCQWEAEFSHWGSCANVVVYKGSRNVRSIIRTFEFYNDYGDIMFQVVISCCADVAEDIENFKSMNWEVIVIDECQRPSMLAHFDQIKLLAASMRLLLVSSQTKDWNFNYHGVFCLLEPDYNGAEHDMLDANSSSNACKLKKRLAHFIAYECQSETIEFVEFWVPSMLTNVQIEQYCASLFSKSMLLCSSLKCDSTGSLHDILLSTKKCCDHPFLVDWSLRSVVLKGVPIADHFDFEFQLSGKLQLLNKILTEIERRKLRVIIFFQSLGGSGTISIGDILDDFIHQKFGKDTYIRIDGNISRTKKQAVSDMFNSKDSEKFVCLIEARACNPSTKLSSVDTVVIFNSDWDPLNDIKALQKISIGSKFKQMNIFRLYSSCTLEEKVLILAKEGVILESDVKNIKRSICHKLLTWGASCLFRKLDGSTEFDPCSLNAIDMPEQTLLEDVFHDLLQLLPHGSGEWDSTSYLSAKPNSLVLKVQQNKGTYNSRFSLHGELIVQSMDNFSIVRRLIDTEPPHIFWTNLLKGRQPRWRYMSSPLQRVKRKVRSLDDLLRETVDEEGAKKKARVEANGIDNCPPKPDSMTKLTQGSATKKDKSAMTQGLVNDVPPVICALKATGAARDYATRVQQHCEAVNLSISETSTNNIYPGGEPDSPGEFCSLADQSYEVPGEPDSPGEFCSLPDQVPLLCNSTIARETAIFESTSMSSGAQGGHSNCTEGGHVCQGQAPADTSMQGLACLLSPSIQQSIQNLAPQASVTSIDGSELDAASLGHQYTIAHSSSDHPSEMSSGTSLSTDLASLQRLKATMQKGELLAQKLHNDLKVHLESEREKEIEDINKKYDMLIRNAENAVAKTKTYLDSCYNMVHKHTLLAEALRKYDQISATGMQGKGEGPLQEEPRNCMMDNKSAVQPAAMRIPASPGQDLMGLYAADPALATSLPVMQQSAEAPESSSSITAAEDRSSAKLGVVSSSRILFEQIHTSHLRLPRMPTIHISGTTWAGRHLRAPAPHLRHTRPPPAVSALCHDPSAR